MQDAQIIQEVMNQVQKKLQGNDVPNSEKKICCGLTEFVGTSFGDSIGLVIANVDEQLRERLDIDPKYRSLGIIGSRTGAGPQIIACDEAVKASNTELIIFELPRDTKGNAGHGTLAVFGAEEVSDARRAVEITLKALEWTFGDIYMNDAGFLEFQYTARASYALAKFFNAPLGKAWGLIVGCPAGIGMVEADTAVKAANVDIVMHASPAFNTSHSNEFMIMISGDSGAVKQAVMAGREIGLQLLSTMGDVPQSLQTPYIR
ncbi:MAG: propanediol utilization microcompartment protein PduB [Dehalobacterium sp.]